MKVLHACLSNYYVDNMAYQENMLVRQNIEDGHDVLVIASTEILDSRNRLNYLPPGEYLGSEGALVTRLPYKTLPRQIARKIRSYQGLMERISTFGPDVILFHGLASWDLPSVASYASSNQIPFFVDTHSDHNNSGRNWVSRNILHGVFYRWLIKKSLHAVAKVLCVSIDTLYFAKEMYGISEEKLELFPLGGKLASLEQIEAAKVSVRRAHRLSEKQIIFVQSGKFGPLKRLVNTLVSFAAIPDKNIVLLLAGQIDPAIESEVMPMIQADPRVRLLGWLKPDELYVILCAADVYIQPGSQSATMQQAMCCQCAIILDDVRSHRHYLANNGFLIDGAQPFSKILDDMVDGSINLDEMKAASLAFSKEFLDYRKLADRYTSTE